jgi:hypothetical protein
MDEGYIVFWNDQGDNDILCQWCYNELEETGDCYPTDQGETDTPMHCSHCHRPLRYNLTSDGVGYVLDAIVNELLDWDISPIGSILPYYYTCPSTEVVKDWAKDLQWYGGLDPQDEELIEYFLDVAPDTLMYHHRMY